MPSAGKQPCWQTKCFVLHTSHHYRNISARRNSFWRFVVYFWGLGEAFPTTLFYNIIKEEICWLIPSLVTSLFTLYMQLFYTLYITLHFIYNCLHSIYSLLHFICNCLHFIYHCFHFICNSFTFIYSCFHFIYIMFFFTL